MAFVWASLIGAVLCAVYGLWVPAVAFVVAAGFYFYSLRWVDQNSGWN